MKKFDEAFNSNKEEFKRPELRHRNSDLAVSVVVVGAFLAASTGIVGATVVTMGLLSLPTMLRAGYSPQLATGVIAASGTLGQIIPPSIVIVLLGTMAGDLYAAGQEIRAQAAGCSDALTYLGKAAVVSVGTLFQAAMFLLLGLLATPHSVLESVGPGIGLALVLMVVARPVAVFACLWPFHFSSKEMLFIAWVGLRGAVPIILAIFPIIAGVDEKKLMLDLALMVVIFSLLFQGSTIAWVARKLSLALPDQQDRQAMRQIFGDFAFDGHAHMDDICAFYGLEISDSGGRTVAQWYTVILII